MKVSVKNSNQKFEKVAVFFLFKNDKLSGSIKKYEALFTDLIKEKVFQADHKNHFFLPLNSSKKNEFQYLLLVGLGEKNNFDYEVLRQASAKAYKELRTYGQKQADFFIDNLITERTDRWDDLAEAVSEGLILCSYKCDEFKKNKRWNKEKRVHFVCSIVSPSDKKKQVQKGLWKGQVLAEATNFTKKLANYPGNLMTPSILAKEVQRQTQNTNIKTIVWDKKRIAKEKMGGLLGVSLGSVQEPRFIIMEYKGAGSGKKHVALVGKGLTFDSGGISLKPSHRMHEMKFDMCGAASVIGTLIAIEKLGIKVNVTAYIPSSENMPGQSANKPGDILVARNGKSMEVLNTDAEGRLILADALSYASEQNPQVIFDVATLTGAVLSALGNIYTGFFTKRFDLAKKINTASQISGEKFWQLPLMEEHSKDIKSSVADVANISSTSGAGSSTAAAFLEHFVDKEIPWAHFDIAGTAWSVHNRLEYCSNHMASGVMVRTFVELIHSYE